MSYRLSQLSPQTSTSGTSVRISVHSPWSAQPESLRDMQFWRSWLEFDSEVSAARKRSRVNWNGVIGLATMAGISVSFWAGMAFLVSRMVR